MSSDSRTILERGILILKSFSVRGGSAFRGYPEQLHDHIGSHLSSRRGFCVQWHLHGSNDERQLKADLGGAQCMTKRWLAKTCEYSHPRIGRLRLAPHDDKSIEMAKFLLKVNRDARDQAPALTLCDRGGKMEELFPLLQRPAGSFSIHLIRAVFVLPYQSFSAVADDIRQGR